MRRTFVDVWGKHRAAQPMQPLEQLIAETIAQHPEYHSLLETPGTLDREFTPEAGQTNPFLHMAMHLALREQLSVDRPGGIGALFRKMVQRSGDPHEVEHQLIECLGRMLWEVQRNNCPFDETGYMECIKTIARERR